MKSLRTQKVSCFSQMNLSSSTLDKASRHLKRSIHLCLDHKPRDLQSQNTNDECPPRMVIYVARLRRRTKNKKYVKSKLTVSLHLLIFRDIV